MDRSIFYLLLLSAIVSVKCKVNQDSINADLVISKVDRKVDVSTHLVRIQSTITLENTGSSAVKSFLYVLHPSLQNWLSFIGAAVKKDDSDSKLKVASTTVANHGDKKFWRIDLASSLEAGKTTTFDVDTVFGHALRPYPSQITQAEKQFVVFEESVYFYSPYKTSTQSTTVTTASSTLESYTKSPKPVSQSETTITYGPYENRAPFTEAELSVHSENNSPFMAVTSLQRLIEVSHWGNIAVEEHVTVRHTGAVLKGPFSRYDYQRSSDGVSSIKVLKMILPSSASDVYYRDEIGNISTSNMREMDDMVELELRPRFPLFGGWKTKYYMGYNVPSYEYLYNKDDLYVLKMRFVDHLFDDMLVDDMTMKIILPEGAKNIALRTPYDVKREKDDLHYTYLDTVGRPVIIVQKKNLVEQHIQLFEVEYTFQKMLLLQEPMLVVGAFYLLFLLVIVYVRLDFSITKDEAKESRMRISSLVEDVQSTQDKRSALYQSYDDAINKFKTSKDNNIFVSSRKKIDADYKQLTQLIQSLQAQLKAEGSDGTEKVAELQRLDGQYKEQIALAVTFAEKLLSGKLGKQQYLDADTMTSAKREEIYQKMETLRQTL